MPQPVLFQRALCCFVLMGSWRKLSCTNCRLKSVHNNSWTAVYNRLVPVHYEYAPKISRKRSIIQNMAVAESQRNLQIIKLWKHDILIRKKVGWHSTECWIINLRRSALEITLNNLGQSPSKGCLAILSKPSQNNPWIIKRKSYFTCGPTK